MLDIDAVLARIETISESLRSHGVTEVAVFGSVARGEAKEGSDIDILIDFEPAHETYDELLAVADLLESALESRVDLVTRNGLSAYVEPFIEREARRAQIA